MHDGKLFRRSRNIAEVRVTHADREANSAQRKCLNAIREQLRPAAGCFLFFMPAEASLYLACC